MQLHFLTSFEVSCDQVLAKEMSVEGMPVTSRQKFQEPMHNSPWFLPAAALLQESAWVPDWHRKSSLTHSCWSYWDKSLRFWNCSVLQPIYTDRAIIFYSDLNEVEYLFSSHRRSYLESWYTFFGKGFRDHRLYWAETELQ